LNENDGQAVGKERRKDDDDPRNFGTVMLDHHIPSGETHEEGCFAEKTKEGKGVD